MYSAKVTALRSMISTTLQPLPGDQNELFHLASITTCLSGVLLQAARADGVLPLFMGGAVGWGAMWLLRISLGGKWI